jgi:predicted  nucleic acid-binding Zn-ribbon protein
MEQAHCNALEAMRSKVGLLETQLSKKSEELDALRKGQENESQTIEELREAMQKAKQESDEMLKDAYANIEAFAAERDELTLNVTHLDREVCATNRSRS